MRNGKWIHDLTAATPLTDAARQVLAVRFDAVHKHLPLALHEAAQDVEHVHQLRVATRRARAALDIFADCLPDDSFAAAKKQLRKIRRAAGAARDWDVFLATLTPTKPRVTARNMPGRDLLVGYALAQRRAAGQQLADLGANYPDKFQGVEAELLAAISPRRHKQTLLQLAQALLTGLAQKLQETMAVNLDDYAQLHQVRIAGKRLRYAMEIFAACFPPAFREQLYPAVESMQDILGFANDSHIARGHLDDVLALLAFVPARAGKRLRPGIEALRKFHIDRLARQRDSFDKWRQQWPQLCSTAAFATNV